MNDEAFLARIDRGERFAKGDILEVELQIDQVLDPNINTYINKGYQIVHVTAHVPRAEQGSLLFPTDPSEPENKKFNFSKFVHELGEGTPPKEDEE
jgi:hypothetical protein